MPQHTPRARARVRAVKKVTSGTNVAKKTKKRKRL